MSRPEGSAQTLFPPEFPPGLPPRLPAYAELCCSSNFSFLRGASHPEELVQRAHQLGYRALAITDECSLAGVVRAHVVARALVSAPAREPAQRPDPGEPAFKLIVGSHFEVGGPWPFTLVVLACNLNGYGNLSQFITRLRRASPKGTYRATPADFRAEPQPAGPAQPAGGASAAAPLADCLVLALPRRSSTPEQLLALSRWLLRHFSGRCWWAMSFLGQLDDELWLARLRELAQFSSVPLLAVGDVLMHLRSRKPLHDVLSAIRLGRPVAECGFELQPSAERCLRSRLRLAQCCPPELLAETLKVAERCQFSLAELRYEYPSEFIPPGQSPSAHLRRLTEEGAAKRWSGGPSPKVRQQIEHELALIAELGYEHYFLTVADIVQFARSRQILCQGRGSAANSVVCFCLGITEVDPARMSMLFERFISRERNEPPDIDVDFEHERREEVIQYLYAKYGRERAALTAAVHCYHAKGALRDVGKALGFVAEQQEALARSLRRWHGPLDPSAPEVADGLAAAGLSVEPADAADAADGQAGGASDAAANDAGAALAVRQWLELSQQLIGFPRHLSQHTGGFVLTGGLLSRLVPIENAAMPERTVIQWDKDDLDALGLLKVDVLALGMLSALRKALHLVSQRLGRPADQPLGLADIPEGDAATYAMISAADTVGVFQIESRAQMSMLPRLKPACYYDLVIEVALVRPGPIQGGAVHPYLNRRQGREPVSYPSEALRQALGRTLGVPIFQEQCMQIAILAAGFSPGEADGLRRAMAAWKRKGGLGKYERRLVDGMTERGYTLEFAQGVFEQIKGFSDYGFPESHAASFALLVYASAWIKCHYPAEFLVALLNSQPMGFYSPSQLTQDARRHGVAVLPVDVSFSEAESRLEPPHPGVRLGLHPVDGLATAAAQRIVAARQADGPFADTQDLARRAALERPDLQRLAAADALASLAGHRRQQVWAASAQHRVPALLRDAPVAEPALALPEAPEGESIVFDYQSTGLTLRRHPMALLRPLLAERRLLCAQDMHGQPDGRLLRTAGIVTLRQQPGTAKGTVFITLEDETGVVQVICWQRVRERFRRVLLSARLLVVYGHWQFESGVGNLIAGYLEDATPLLGRLAESARSRDFR